ncbi:MAG: hypothetical protein Unbinned7794contig1000_17 [Prokaryotic dsDNA virus sp.]|nr:MAG: hypothetical protein Unbinned7794contig1000_17 [Prokaryotic dsDNA virus sp.]|tara:strand:+ start:3151 stop:3330 length:180 start_codon:yes stop_codon:yes gene_type:complete
MTETTDDADIKHKLTVSGEQLTPMQQRRCVQLIEKFGPEGVGLVEALSKSLEALNEDNS